MALDFSSLLAAVDFGDSGAAILAIAALMCVPMVLKWGAQKVLGFIGDSGDDDEAKRDYDAQ